MIKCPFCKKEVSIDQTNKFSKSSCEHCNRKFHSDFDLFEFFNVNSNLFVIMSVFGGIAVILPVFVSSEVMKPSTNPIFYHTPPESLATLITICIQLSILASMVLMAFMMLMIFENIIYERENELIWGECLSFTIRSFDLQRLLFLIPFVILGFSLMIYIMLIMGDLFMLATILFLVIYSIIFFIVLRQNPMLRESVIKKEESRK